MFQNILVPLDGSQFGEQALAHALSLSQKYGGKVTLLHVVPANWEGEMRAEMAESEDNAIQAETSGATHYLTEKEQALRAEGYRVTAVIMKGHPIHTMILEATQNEKADTIAMSTHGFSGIRRVMFGNVAKKVIRKATVPVLLVRPTSEN